MAKLKDLVWLAVGIFWPKRAGKPCRTSDELQRDREFAESLAKFAKVPADEAYAFLFKDGWKKP